MSREAFPRDIIWSNETYHLSDVLNKVVLPSTVKVCHGYCSNYEIETFSNGDLLHLKNCVTIQKVAAHFVQRMKTSKSSSFDIIGEEILIPLNFKGPIKLINDNQTKTKFYSVQELIDTFPRFVKNEKEIEGTCGKRATRKIKEGKRLQLIRLLPGTLHRHKKSSDQLICIYENKEIALSATTKGRFSLLQDETVYTLASLVDTLPLPRTVIFVDNEPWHGVGGSADNICGSTLRLHKIVLQKVIIAYHEPAGIEISHHGPDGVISLPLDNHAVQELRVNILKEIHAKTSKEIIPKNIREILDKDLGEWMYVERSHNPKVRYLFDDFPGRRVKQNKYWSIDDISAKSFNTKSTSGSQDGWSSSEFSLCSQDIAQPSSIYDTVENVPRIETAPDQEHSSWRPEPDYSADYDDVIYNKQKDPLHKRYHDESSEKQVDETMPIDHIDHLRSPEVRTGYINMPFCGRSSANRNSQENVYQDVKTPPPKPPRKDKGLKRIFSFKQENKKSSTKSSVPDPSLNVPVSNARSPCDVSDKLEWNSNPIYTYIDSNDLDRVKSSVLRKNRVLERPKSVDVLEENYADKIADRPQTRPYSAHGLDWRSLNKRTISDNMSENENITSVGNGASMPRRFSQLARGENETQDHSIVANLSLIYPKQTHEQTVTSGGITASIDRCFEVLAEVCEIEEELNRNSSDSNNKKQEAVQSRMMTKTDNDIEQLIDYCNIVSETFEDMKNTQINRQELSSNRRSETQPE